MRRLILRLAELDRSTKSVIILTTDFVAIFVSLFFAIYLRRAELLGLLTLSNTVIAAITATVSIAVFRILRVYGHVIRFYATSIYLKVAISLLFVAVLQLACTLAADQLTGNDFGSTLPRTVPFIFFFVSFLAVSSTRVLAKELLNRARPAGRPNGVLIFGAGRTGQQLARELNLRTDFSVRGFVDDDPSIQKLHIRGHRVFSRQAATKQIDRENITQLFLAVPSLSQQARNDIIEDFVETGVKIQTVPRIDHVLSGRARISEFREVFTEDILGRAPIPPKASLMERNIKGRNVLVTGAGGSIGSELARQIAGYSPASLVLLDSNEYGLYNVENDIRNLAAKKDRPVDCKPALANIQDAEALANVFREGRFDTVFHAAAYKHVPLVESNMAEGVKNNVFGTLNLVDAAVAHGVKAFTLISTDKAVRSTNVMGATKRIAELICQARQDEAPDICFSMVRFGNVLESSGSVIPRFRDQISRGGPVTVTHRDVTRYFMTIPEAAQLVIQAGSLAKGGEVFLLDMGEPVKIYDLAARMITLSGRKPVDEEVVQSRGLEPDEIELRVIGLRPGEKLYEELLISGDFSKTRHPKIFMARDEKLAWRELERYLKDLHAACSKFDRREIARQISRLPIQYRKPSKKNTIVMMD